MRRFILLFLLSVAIAALSGCHKEAPASISANRMLLQAGGETVEVPYVRPIALNGMPAENILAVRKKIADDLPGLLIQPYTAFLDVFAPIDPKLRWESRYSFFVGNQNSFCGEGLAVDSDILLNPYMLITPRFFGLLRSQISMKWDIARIAAEQPPFETMPVSPVPESLKYFKADKRAELVFDISSYLQELNPWLLRGLTPDQVIFSLWPINARDLGLNFVRLSAAASSNLTLPPDRGSLRLTETLHPRRIGKSPEACNSGGRPDPAHYGLRVQNLPAKLTVLLWEQKPTDRSPPDLSYEIVLK